MRKKLLILLLLTAIFLIDVDTAYAVGVQGGIINNNNSNISDQDGGQGKKLNYDSGNKRYLCEYKQKVNYDVKIEINAYDLNGTSLIPYSFTPSNTVKAGTWVGINANEYKSSSWQVSSFKYYEVQKKVVCEYEKPATTEEECHGGGKKCVLTLKPTCPMGYERSGLFDDGGDHFWTNCCKKIPLICTKKPIPAESTGTIVEHFSYHDPKAENFKCDPTYNGGILKNKTIIDDPVETSDPAAKECKVSAEGIAAGISAGMVNNPSNILEYIDTNNYDTDDFEKNLSSVEGVKVDGGSTSSSSTDSASGGAWATFSYSPQKTCIDVKTAKVTYDNKCIESDSNKLIPNTTVYDKYIKEDVTYWHYFIPLNAKTDSIFYVRLKENKASLYDEKICKGFIENSPNDYPNIIKPKNGGVFIGDYSKGKNSSDYKKLKSGCYVAMTVYFKVDQDFYNEKSVNSAYSLNGYKFYFRQVDINKPFNTIPNASSSWYEWYNKNSKNGTANFNKSFNTITYMADVLKPDKIRKYNSNSDNFYTSWQKMREDGTSEFITKNDFVTRKNPGSTYKLGCGPGNADWSGCK